jgi:hypothetical protein
LFGQCYVAPRTPKNIGSGLAVGPLPSWFMRPDRHNQFGQASIRSEFLFRVWALVEDLLAKQFGLSQIPLGSLWNPLCVGHADFQSVDTLPSQSITLEAKSPVRRLELIGTDLAFFRHR